MKLSANSNAQVVRMCQLCYYSAVINYLQSHEFVLIYSAKQFISLRMALMYNITDIKHGYYNHEVTCTNTSDDSIKLSFKLLCKYFEVTPS